MTSNYPNQNVVEEEIDSNGQAIDDADKAERVTKYMSELVSDYTKSIRPKDSDQFPSLWPLHWKTLPPTPREKMLINLKRL